jgi:hypothetical protein
VPGLRLRGHEVAFAAEARLPSDVLPVRGPFVVRKDDGTPFRARRLAAMLDESGPDG